jgi:hypothetical protein
MNFPDDPWALLELDRKVAGEREVKRAYARLLKLHRPENDPEGFRRVNGAYQAALMDLARGVEPSGQAELTPGDPAELANVSEPILTETDAVPEAVPITLREVDPVVLASFEETRENLFKRLEMVAASTQVPQFTRLRNLVRQHPELADRWVVVMRRLVQGPEWQMVVSGLHAEDVWLLMREGEGQFAAQVMLQWREDPVLLGRFGTMGNLLLQQKEGLDHPDRLQAMHFTARTVAFYVPEVSARLADELFRQSGPGVRERIVNDIEVRSAAGKMFHRFALPVRRFWEEQLFDSDTEEADWSDPRKLSALREVVSACPAEWEGWGVVSQVVPDEVLQPMLAQRREPKRIYDTELAPDRPWYASFWGSENWRWIAALVIIKGFFFILKPDKSPPPSTSPSAPHSYPSARPEYRESQSTLKAQRLLDELRAERLKAKGLPEPSLPGGSDNLRDFDFSPKPGEGSDAKKLRLEY